MIYPEDCIKKYGNPDPQFEKVWMTGFEIPEDLHQLIIPLPGKIYMNKDLVQPFFEALLLIQARHLQDKFMEWGGCFCIRNQRGSLNQSIHSWAIAIDINENTNKLGKTPQIDPLLVSCFKEVGFDWGGDWRRRDGMHFQLSSI